jgi:hypothetical protein
MGPPAPLPNEDAALQRPTAELKAEDEAATGPKPGEESPGNKE